ncbi:unnamed protein product [Leptosia nina]|uniref:Uncharacterized protein n=1 Tax=Leptosia nina TaxID=320188 RepID=A0AAV1IVC4_9NEOP
MKLDGMQHPTTLNLLSTFPRNQVMIVTKLFAAESVQFLFNVYGCGAGHSFCGDIDGVPLGQRGVLPGPTQINPRAFRGGKVAGCSTGPMVSGARVNAPKHHAIITHPQSP